MATNPAYRVPELTCEVETKPDETIVHCSGRIISETTESLKRVVKPLLGAETKILVLDLSHVNYVDSSGLGSIIALYVSAKGAHCQFTVINLNPRVRELFSLTRLGEVLTQGRDPDRKGMFYSGL